MSRTKTGKRLIWAKPGPRRGQLVAAIRRNTRDIKLRVRGTGEEVQLREKGRP